MPTSDETVRQIVDAPDWARRIQFIRQIPEHHGTAEHINIYAAVAKRLYVPHLTPDFAYIHDAPYYKEDYFFAAYSAAEQITEGFSKVGEQDLANALLSQPFTLLVFRTLLGLTKDEFAHSTELVASTTDLLSLSASQVDKWERDGATPRSSPSDADRAKAAVAASTISRIMNGTLFDPPPPGLRSKQEKPDTLKGWTSVRSFARTGVPLNVFLHQRHYGGAYRQLLDATSSKRGDLIEDEVERVFVERHISFVRTGSHNQGDVAERFGVTVTPAPDFVVFDPSDDGLRAMLECKGTNDGGTARDKALRFARLRTESARLNGVPLFAVLGGTGWARVRDALAPVIRDTDGRVFTPSTIRSILEVAPFPELILSAARS